jgi:phosphonate transport system substrate-binding protein
MSRSLRFVIRSLSATAYAVLITAFMHNAANAENVTLSFGISPQKNATELATLWMPVFDWLNKTTGCTLQFATAKDSAIFEQRLAEGAYDLAYMNPYTYTQVHRTAGYEAFAKAKDAQLVGIIVAPKDSAVQKLLDFKDKTLAFPSPSSFAAAMLTYASLQKAGANITAQFVSSHESVYRAVAKGLFPGGGGILKTLNQMEPGVRDQLRIVWTSPPYESHPIAAHPRVAKEILHRIQSAMLHMHEDAQAAAALKAVSFKGIIAAEDRNYDDIRALNIQPPNKND